jgi:short-subunit dehydrogenase
VVSGASRGLGEALAHALAAAEDTVVVPLARSSLTRPPVVRAGWEPRTLDLSDGAAVARVATDIERTVGAPEILLNVAALADYDERATIDRERLSAMVDVNLLAVAQLCQAFAPAMARRRSGTIVNVSSLAALRPIDGFGAYGATKAALDAYTRALRVELRGSGVRVLLVRPGRMATGLFDASGAPQALVTEARRFPQPAEVARTVLDNLDADGELVVRGDRQLVLANRFLPDRLADRVWRSRT